MKKTILYLSLTLSLLIGLTGCTDSKKDPKSLDYPKPITESQVISLTLESEILGRSMPLMLYLPKGYGGGQEYPVWYGLHSYGANESMWIKQGIAEAADELIEQGEIKPLIIVFPFVKDADLKEITEDLEDGIIDERKIDQYISKELIPYIDSLYYTEDSRESRYIGGFSMGGMLSLRIAFHHTDQFSKVGGYSPAVPSNDYSDSQLEKWLFPNEDTSSINDLSAYIKEKGLDQLLIYMDAGNLNDPFSEGVQSLYDALQKRGIASDFIKYDGGHSIQKDNIKDYLKFYAGIE